MSAKKKSEETPRRRTGDKTPGCASILAVAILIAIAIGLIYWFLPKIVSWSTATWDNLLVLFGAGLTLVAVYLFVVLMLLLGKRLGLLAKYWNICVGIIALTLTAFGVMAFISTDMGGTFGKAIIGNSPITGVLRLIGLAFLGILFLAPLQTWNVMVIMVIALGRAIWQILLSIDRSIKVPAKSETTSESKHVQEIPMEKVEPATQPIHIPEPIQSSPGMAPSISGATKVEPQEPIRLRPSLTVGGWQLPPINILDKPVDTDVSQADVKKRAEIIMESLSSYGVDAQVVQINIGPTVTQFGVEPGWDIKYKEIKEKDKDGNIKTKLQEVSKTRVKVERITSLSNDLSLALAASSIRIEAPVPGKSIVGIEVPNTTFGSVNLRSIIESTSFQKISAKSRMAIGLGKGAGGETVSADLTKMPHLLIAGATGSGKTVYLNSIICCLLIFNTPDDLRFIMIDPKRVELVNFNTLPHLIAPVVVETDKAVSALRWLTEEMDDRYRRFSQAGARNIEGYNKDRQPGEALPYIVLVIDELADLMMAAFDEVEHTLCRLAQLSRATGIHLIVATQRPSVDVVTGLIKANFPTRISFSLTSQVDSRTILDSAGAEKLLGRGDMLYMPTDASKPKRLQGPFLTDPEIDRLTNFWGNQRKPGAEPIKFEDVAPATGAGADSDDTLLEAAKKLADEHEQISVSFLQRRLRIGYPRAARLYDKLKEEGFVEENK
jgi:S-DNA-T family DNA segregation ATPase FtsK/SpoIIIE